MASIQRHFGSTSGQYANQISAEDGRAKAVLSACRGARRILDAGCGKGRYAALVKAFFPEADVHGTDISPEMLAAVPQGIQTQVASFQDMPYPDHSFDVVYCVEALEHAPNPATAVAELARLVRPGGQLIIIDKNIEKLGALQIERWENWFARDKLAALLNQNEMNCSVTELSYEGRPADGLFLCWHGLKNAQSQSATGTGGRIA